MLFIRTITITNFGPFKDEQRIEFPAEKGVVIVYGENMRGKTMLLNAIRYALFGKVITRGANQMALHQIGNWETALEKNLYGFKVVLEFEHEGSNYQLTRENLPRDGVTTPKSDMDYKQNFYLSKDNDVLGPDAQEAELARIMPETVSRFFLFDGELLQQYEELLRDESTMGHKIKDAIERILGLPVLTNGRADLSELSKDAQKREAKTAQKNQKTKELGNHHESLLQQRDEQLKELESLKEKLVKLRSNKSSQEDLLKRTEKTKNLLEERTHVQQDIDSLELRLKQKDESLKEYLAVAWKSLLKNRINLTLDTLEQELKNTRDIHLRSIFTSEISEELRKGLDHDECSICGQKLLGSARDRLHAQISETISKDDLQRIETNIYQLESRIHALKQSEPTNNVDVLQELHDEIDDLKIKKTAAEDRLGDILERTKDLDESVIRQIYSDYEKVIHEIGILQEGIKKQEAALGIINDRISLVEIEIGKFAGTDLEKARERRDLCDKLKSLFAQAVDGYRDRLRERVEKDATSIFLKLTSEPEYKGLSINDRYGLTIVHQDGSTIQVRSAGAEHIVTLSLMGALQKNAPLRGPIVMDSPFGRLDQVHTTKVVKALPSIADQVMLLVYESELDPQQARNELLGNLRKEYYIARRTARHSIIEVKL